jgi:gluconate 2-dehydrogenase gamma chain
MLRAYAALRWRQSREWQLPHITRRIFVITIGAAAVVPAALRRLAAPCASELSSYRFFRTTEAQFIESACDRLIPADESGPGAGGAGVPRYLDSQLGGAWGLGQRPHRSGPWQPGTPSPVYWLPLTPAALFRTALRAIIEGFESRGTAFHELSADAQDAYLRSLEAGAVELDGVSSAVFFDMLLKMTVEGFFSDPVHGRDRGLVAWRVHGFPGAYAARNRFAMSQSQR